MLADVMERLRDKGDGPLLIDNAIDANELTYLPRGIGTCWRHLSFLVGASISPFGMAVLSPTVE